MLARFVKKKNVDIKFNEPYEPDFFISKLKESHLETHVTNAINILENDSNHNWFGFGPIIISFIFILLNFIFLIVVCILMLILNYLFGLFYTFDILIVSYTIITTIFLIVTVIAFVIIFIIILNKTDIKFDWSMILIGGIILGLYSLTFIIYYIIILLITFDVFSVKSGEWNLLYWTLFVIYTLSMFIFICSICIWLVPVFISIIAGNSIFKSTKASNLAHTFMVDDNADLDNLAKNKIVQQKIVQIYSNLMGYNPWNQEKREENLSAEYGVHKKNIKINL